jgi:transposase InsO family protein
MWTYIIKAKNEAFNYFTKFKEVVEAETGHKIKTLRTDRGGEFTSNQFKNFCESNGILRQLTAPYTLQQNGVVERKNRTVIGTTQCLLKGMNLPQNLWAE